MSNNYNKFFNQNGIANVPTAVPQIILEDKNEQKHVDKIVNEEIKAVVVNCKRLNVRDKPGFKGTVVEIIRVNSEVAILDLIDGWAHVRTNKGIGYVMLEYIKEV